MKLISMTDFVLEQTEQLYDKNQSKLIHNIVNYAQFLKQPLKLEMFVPCDENNEPLDEFIHNINLTTMSDDWNKAKEKVLFIPTKEICFSGLFFETFKNIEDLLRINYSEFTLTESATKQFI